MNKTEIFLRFVVSMEKFMVESHLDYPQRDDYLVGCAEIICIYPHVVSYGIDKQDICMLTKGKIYKVINVGTWLVSVVGDDGEIGSFDKRRFYAYSFIESSVDSSDSDSDFNNACHEKPFEVYKNNKFFGIF